MANCLRDDKNTAFCISSPSLAIAEEHGKFHETRAHISRKFSLIG